MTHLPTKCPFQLFCYFWNDSVMITALFGFWFVHFFFFPYVHFSSVNFSSPRTLLFSHHSTFGCNAPQPLPFPPTSVFLPCPSHRAVLFLKQRHVCFECKNSLSSPNIQCQERQGITGKGGREEQKKVEREERRKVYDREEHRTQRAGTQGRLS